MRLALLQQLNARLCARKTCLLLTRLDGEEQRLLRAEDLAEDPLADLLAPLFADGRSQIIEQAGRRYFVDMRRPAPRLIVIGAVHIAQALAPMAQLAGIATQIIDPRQGFATSERFPGMALTTQWPQDALPGFGLDEGTALAALTHDPKIDDPALLLALQSSCFYIGALGSRKSHARRLERLQALGAPSAELARIKAPIGLDIGAASPAEIAVAILAEIIGGLRRKPTRQSAERAAAKA